VEHSTTVTLLPFLAILGLSTIFVGVALLIGVWIPQWVQSRRPIEGSPAESLDDTAPTGRFGIDD
jgi:hypothetical protein